MEQARTLLASLRPQIDEFVGLRADLTEAVHARDEGSEPDTVALADLKGMEARLSELLDGFRAHGVEVKGWAPLLLDFPAERDGRSVLLCWIEGEPALAWYHDTRYGFAGRRPLDDGGSEDRRAPSG